MTDGHSDTCGCWECEDVREIKGEETVHAKQDREANERATQALHDKGYRCTCTDPYAAYHSSRCPVWEYWRKNKEAEC